MKIKLDLTAQDLAELNDEETAVAVKTAAHALLDYIFENKGSMAKCSITLDEKDVE